MTNFSNATNTRVQIVGHRGAKGIAPENTAASFLKAIEIGVDAIELDLHVSRDGELVVMHDPSIARTTDGTGEIGDFTFAELQTLNAAAKFVGANQFAPQKILTLARVFELVQSRTRLYLEIKTRSNGRRYPGIEELMLNVVRQYDALSTAIVSSFDFPSLDKVKRLAPEFRTQVNISKGYMSGVEAHGPRAIALDLAQRGFQWIAVDKKYLTPELFHALKAQGMNVHPWVVNEVSEMWHFVNMGVDLITTDRPDLLVPAYRSNIVNGGPAPNEPSLH